MITLCLDAFQSNVHLRTQIKVGCMKIEILTTLNEEFDNTGFGTIQASNSVLDSIRKMGHIVELNVCKTHDDLHDVVQRKPDLVILASKYMDIKDEDDIWLSEYFEKNDINYSGSSSETLKFDFDNILAKSYLRSKGVNTTKYFTATPGEYKCTFDLPVGYPLLLKPLDAANSNPIDDLSPIMNFKDFQSKLLSLYELFDAPVLVEEYIDGPEFTVALLKANDGDLLVSAIEVIQPEPIKTPKIFGEKVKQKTQELRTTKDIIMLNRVKALAVDAYIDLGIRDFGLINIKTNNYGHCFFMEAKLIPNMTNSSSCFTKACEMEHSLSYDNVIELIVNEGLSRVAS